MPAALKVLSGPLKERVLLLPIDGPFILGRSMEANLTLNGPRVEDRHAVLVPEGEAHRLVPVATRRPTFLDGSKLKHVHVLSSGDCIKIGNHIMVYVTPWSREPISRGRGWGAAAAGGATPEVPCSSCGEPLGPKTGGQPTLKALRVEDDVICPRCVDSRLHLDRDLETYRILRKVATNEEEVTYLAVDLETNQRVALRIMKADQQARLRKFRRYLVRALCGLTLDHQNYLQVLGIRASRGITFVVLEHIDETTKLEVLVRDRSPLQVSEAIYITNQLAEVLRYARERELVVAKRRKSGVLVDASFWVKVMAYDVTRELEARVAATDAFADMAERAGCDPRHLAEVDAVPKTEDEQRLGQIASEFAEVYSVGRILFHLLSGKPFGPGTIDTVRASCVAARKRGSPEKGPLKDHRLPVVELLERVIVPKGPERIRTLEDYLRSSKVAYARMLEGS